MKKIRVYENDTAIVVDPKLEKKGVSITANQPLVKEVKANEANMKKYIKKRRGRPNE